MSVYYPWPAFLLLALPRLFGGLVLLRELNVPVTVKNYLVPDRQLMFWHRRFEISNRNRPVIFRSCMEYASGNEIIEYVGRKRRMNIGVRMSVTEHKGALHFESTGYILTFGGFQIPLPGNFLLGRAEIIEKPLGGNSISMSFSIRHALWGEIYTYSGEFTIQNG